MAGSSTFIAISFLMIQALFCSITVESKLVPAIFVFGDSLADVGNNNYLNVPLSDKSNFPFNGIDFPGQVPTGRFSNGFNGIDFIARNLGFKKSPPPYLSIKNANKMKKGVSFASAGSGILQTTGIGTLNMATQVNYFARTKEALVKQFGEKTVNDLLAKSLFYFVTANNDMFAYYSTTGAANSTQNAQFISYLVEEFIGHLTTIYKLGARKFAISGTGAVGCVPYLRSLNPTGGCIDALSLLSVQFNTVTMPRIQQLSNQLAGFKYSYLNSNNITAKIAPSPDAFGFKEVESARSGAMHLKCNPMFKQGSTLLLGLVSSNTGSCQVNSPFSVLWFHRRGRACQREATSGVFKIEKHLAFIEKPFVHP